MEPYLAEWGSLLLRWLHVVTAAAWIGASFFFMHLDASLRATPDIAAGKGGAAWQVHGGGFYEMRKYLVAPDAMPADLTWHKWQSYWTWLSGFFLLVWVYYGQSQLYLIDPAVMQLAGWQAALIGIGGLALGWVIYDLLCRSPLGKNDNLLACVGFGYVVASSFVFSLFFSGRGTLVHTGALMATLMTGNVFFVIIPNQRKVVAALLAGAAPDPRLGDEAKQRSKHNNYITLPVFLLMLSNHYPVVWANSAVIPPIVALVILAGAVIRHFYNARHAGHAASPWWAWGVAAAALGAAFWIAMAASPGGRERLGLKPREVPSVAMAGAALPPHEIVELLQSRCAMCHAAEPVWDGIQIAPKGVLLDTPEHIAQQAPAIRLQAVLTHAMPPNNLTEVTPEERRMLAAWLRGAP